MTRNRRNEYDLRLTDQIHIHLPANAFRIEASIPLLIAFVGGYAIFELLSSMGER